MLAEAEGDPVQVILRGETLEGEAVAGQAVEGQGQVLGVVLVLALMGVLGEHLGRAAEGVLALEAGAQALGVALLVVVVERSGAGTILGIAVDLHPRVVGADERRQVPGAVGLLGDVVAQACAECPQVAVGVALLAARTAAQGELALQVVVVEVAAGQRGIGPPAVLLVLDEGGGQVTVQVVVGVLGAGFQFLLVEAGRDAGAPGVVDPVAAAEGEVVAIAVATGRAVLGVEVQVLAAAGDEAAPLADVLPVLPVRLPLVAQFVLVGTQGAMSHFRQQGHFPRRRQQGVGVVGNQQLAGDGRVHAVVEQQLGRVRRGAVDPVGGVHGAAVATEAGADQVLVGGQAEGAGIGQALLEQQGYVQRDDIGVHLAQLRGQLGVEGATELGGEGLYRGAEGGRGQAQVGQQPDHDVAGAGLLQGLHAVDQASRRLACLDVVEDAPLEKVVAASGEVVERVRIGAQALAGAVHQIAVAAAQGSTVALDHRATRRGDRVEDLVGAVAADGPVVAVRDALLGVDRRGGRRQVAGGDAELAAQQHGRHRAEYLAAAGLEGRPDPVGEARGAAGRTARIRELPGIAEAVAEHHHGGIGRGCRL
ncbi:hypothetical protein D9M68_361790 [compost metagenome]